MTNSTWPLHIVLALTLAGNPVVADSIAAIPARIAPPRMTAGIHAPATRITAPDPLNLAEQRRANRGTHALVGGAIGAVAGVAICTLFANIAKDKGQPFETCTLQDNVYLGAAGFGAGAIIGAIAG